jgi:serine/threonine protein kinase
MDKVAKYSIMEELGRGSEGVVFRAMDVDSQRQLALKTIKVNPELPDDDPELLRIIHATEEQCKKLSEIEHRNVARVFEAGYQDGVIYIARELIEGKTLKWYMEDTGKVKVEEAVEMVKDIAKGLKAIHKLGIVMGGLKPSDIMIRPGVPVIVGFGLPAGPKAS